MGENFDINKVVAELLQKNADKIKDRISLNGGIMRDTETTKR